MYTFEVYKDKAGQFRWRLVAPNKKSIAESGEGYTSKQACLDGIKSVQEHAAGAKVVEV